MYFLTKAYTYVRPGLDDDVARRDSLHAEINNLPDPNYATLRALTLVRLALLLIISKLLKF